MDTIFSRCPVNLKPDDVHSKRHSKKTLPTCGASQAVSVKLTTKGEGSGSRGIYCILPADVASRESPITVIFRHLDAETFLFIRFLSACATCSVVCVICFAFVYPTCDVAGRPRLAAWCHFMGFTSSLTLTLCLDNSLLYRKDNRTKSTVMVTVLLYGSLPIACFNVNLAPPGGHPHAAAFPPSREYPPISSLCCRVQNSQEI